MVLHERCLPRTFPFCPTLPPTRCSIYARCWISNNSRLILYALANSSWILMTTLYRLLAADQALNLLFQRNSVLSCTHGTATHMYYRVSILTCGSVLFLVTFQLAATARWDSETRTTMFARDTYANSQDFEILIQYSRGGGSSWKSWRDIPVRRIAVRCRRAMREKTRA